MKIEELLQKPIGELSPEQLNEVMAHRQAEEKKKTEKAKEAYETDKQEFINDIVAAFKEQAEKLKGIKERGIGKGKELFERIYQINGKEAKEQKSFQIKDKEDKYKVVLDTQERFEFTEEAQVHINAIKDLFKAKFEDRNKGFYNILDNILMRNTKGDYDPKLLTKARIEVKKLGDEALITEFDKLQDCMRVVGTSTYIRVYERGEDKKWRDISLNFSSI